MLEKWDKELIYTIPNFFYIPWSDDEAMVYHHQHNWVYDKHILAIKQSIESYNLDLESPKNYPVFCKPRINPSGMSLGAYICKRKADLPEDYGYVAQELLEGIQYTTDYVIKKGKVLDQFSFISHKDKKGSFTLFESTRKKHKYNEQFIEQYFKDYCGVMNIENIGNKIIEIHLRPSMQFIGICGGLIEQLPNYYDTGKWKKIKWEKTYSKPIRVKEDFIPVYKDSVKLFESVTYIQKCWYEGKPLSYGTNDENSYRIFVVNGKCLQDIENTEKLLMKDLQKR